MTTYSVSPPSSPKMGDRFLPSNSAISAPAGNPTEAYSMHNFHYMLRQRRLFLFSTALVLCTFGILTRIQTVQHQFQPETTNVAAADAAENDDDYYYQHLLDSKSSWPWQQRPAKVEKHAPATLNALTVPKDHLYVPSLEFRIQGKSAYHPSIEEIKKFQQDCPEPAKELEWEWFDPNHPNADPEDEAAGRGLREEPSGSHSYLQPDSSPSSLRRLSSTTTSHKQQQHHHHDDNKNNKKPRLLIGLYAGHDPYGEFLETTAHIAKAYAHRHADHVEVVVLQGTAFAPQGCTPPGSHTTLNKIRLLFYAIDHESLYDQILLLDADAVMYDLDFDLTSLLLRLADENSDSVRGSNEYLLAAQPMRSASNKDDNGDSLRDLAPHKINSGVTLWNLHHPLIRVAALDWFNSAKDDVIAHSYEGDQKHLQSTLYELQAEVQVLLLDTEFAYSEGTVIKHFLQHSNRSWEERKEQIQQAAEEVCEKYPQNCQAVPKKTYRVA